MKNFILLLFACSAFNVAAQVSGYAFSETTETYIPVAGTNSTATGDDGTQNNVAIGFAFPIGGTAFTTVSISTNGFVRLGAAVAATNWVNELGNSAPQRPLIAPCWDDHNRGSGAIRYALSGTAPSRIFEIGWNNVNISGGGNASTTNFASFKMRLHETTGQIDFVYGAMTPVSTPSASIGINSDTDFLSVMPAAMGAVSSAVTAYNTISSTADLAGRKFTFMPTPQCSATPDAGLAVSSASSVCANVAFTLSLDGDFADYGLSFQWESSLDGVTFTDIQGATGQELTVTQEQATYYRAVVACIAGGSDTSEPVQVLQIPGEDCYCYPNYDFGKTDGDLISNVVIVGTPLANNTGTAPVNPAYSVFQGEPFHTAELQAGATYEINVTVGSYGQQNVAVWIDYNDDLVFSEDEKVGYTLDEIASGGTGTFEIQLACDPPAGAHRMRIRDVWNVQGGLIDPCATYGYGETEDYTVTILAGDACAMVDNVTLSNVNSSSALIAWEEGCGHQSWDVYVAPAPAGMPAAGNYLNATSPLVVSGLVPMTAYDVWIKAYCGDGLDSGWAGPFGFTTLPMAVANDECGTASALTIGESFEDAPAIATNVGATQSIAAPNPTCGTWGFGGDVWFIAVVGDTGSLTIETRANAGSSLEDTAMSVYSGTCENLTLLGCSDDEGIGAFSMLSLESLDPGQTLYIRVWEYANDVAGTFQVSAYQQSLSNPDSRFADFGVFPNPVKDVFQMMGVSGNFAIFNALGQNVKAGTAGPQEPIDVSALPTGAYFVKSTVEGKPATAKFIKQ